MLNVMGLCALQSMKRNETSFCDHPWLMIKAYSIISSVSVEQCFYLLNDKNDEKL